jgi:hypothetical protein
MKLCASPANTRCTYQRIARDQADPDNNGANPDLVQTAYSDLYECLASRDDGEALALLTHLMNTLTGDGAQDDIHSVGKSRTIRAMSQDSAIGAKVREGKSLATRYLFDRKFPGASRIRPI